MSKSTKTDSASGASVRTPRSVVDRLLHRDAHRLAARLGDAGRARLRRALRLGRQRAAAAEELRTAGQRAEALRMDARAFEATIEAAPILAAACGVAPEWQAVLRARGLDPARVAAMDETHRRLAATELPEAESDVSEAHLELSGRLRADRRRAHRALRAASWEPWAFGAWRAIGVAAALLVLASIGLGAALFFREPVRVTVSAPVGHAPGFGPENVVDGDGSSEFFWPDRVPGTLEIALSPPQDIHTLRLLNTHNRHFNDRATQDYAVELVVDGEVAERIEGRWPEFRLRPEWNEHAVGVEGVERIRFEARSWHRMGAGLAEIEWE